MQIPLLKGFLNINAGIAQTQDDTYVIYSIRYMLASNATSHRQPSTSAKESILDPYFYHTRSLRSQQCPLTDDVSLGDVNCSRQKAAAMLVRPILTPASTNLGLFCHLIVV